MTKKAVRVKKSIPDKETKSARFIRVVTPRVNKAVKAIDVLGFCAGSSYQFTPKQSKQIIETLLKAITVLDSKFSQKADKQDTFTFVE